VVLAGKQVKQTVAAGQMSSRSEMGWSGASLHRLTWTAISILLGILLRKGVALRCDGGDQTRRENRALHGFKQISKGKTRWP
jgi:chaperone required for assembly of F1-ATPase